MKISFHISEIDSTVASQLEYVLKFNVFKYSRQDSSSTVMADRPRYLSSVFFQAILIFGSKCRARNQYHWDIPNHHVYQSSEAMLLFSLPISAKFFSISDRRDSLYMTPMH